MRTLFLGLGAGLVLTLGCGEASSPKTKPNPPSVETRKEPAGTDEKPAVSKQKTASEKAAEADREVEVSGLVFTAPKTWEQKAAQSSFLVAEFTLPRAKGDEQDGRFTLSSAGGSVEANVQRWKGQFHGSDKMKQEKIQVAGMDVTLVDLRGDFDDQRGPMAPPVKRPGYRMLAAIYPSEGGLTFLKATGPEKTIAEHEAEILAFIKSAKKKS